jgi:hypothetical protein
MKRVMIGLIALGGVALWWTDARAQCPGGVGDGGSCVTMAVLGRSLAGITRSLDPGTSTFEFFGPQAPLGGSATECNHNFSTGVLDPDCRISGTAYCTPSGSSSSFSVSPFSGEGTHTKGTHTKGGGDRRERLKTKPQTLPAGLKLNNLPSDGGMPAGTTKSPSGDPQTEGSFWAVAELEPNSSCVSCPAGTTFFTFLADAFVVRGTFQPEEPCGECGAPPSYTAIQVCERGLISTPTEIRSFNCVTVFQCEGTACPSPNTSPGTLGTCPAD